MLGKLLGISPKKPALPKNQIEVICPVCGAVQREPRLVVTTMCRQCGEHLRIEKKKVIASSQINPVPSAIYPAQQELASSSGPADSGQEHNHGQPAREKAPTPSNLPKVSAQKQPPSALLPQNPTEDPIPLGLGNMIMGVDEAPSQEAPSPEDYQAEETYAETVDHQAQEEELHSSSAAYEESSEVVEQPPAAYEPPPPVVSQPSLPPRRPRIAPQPLRQAPKRPEVVRAPEPSTFQKMREQGIRQQHFKEVECFDCNHKFKVGRSARNSQCPNCSASICLEDVDINVTSTTPIRTRGDVYIRKMGNVSTSEIKCRDLHIHGIISANVECSGELIMRTAGTIVGNIHCIRLHVVKGSDIQLINTVYADEVEVYARICGNIHCNGPVLIGSGGCVEGDVTARSVNIEPGGHLDGAMNILRPANKPKPKPPSDSGEQQNLPL